jgi:hypothetical protein
MHQFRYSVLIPTRVFAEAELRVFEARIDDPILEAVIALG